MKQNAGMGAMPGMLENDDASFDARREERRNF